jgi:hypothetical protein
MQLVFSKRQPGVPYFPGDPPDGACPESVLRESRLAEPPAGRPRRHKRLPSALQKGDFYRLNCSWSDAYERLATRVELLSRVRGMEDSPARRCIETTASGTSAARLFVDLIRTHQSIGEQGCAFSRAPKDSPRIERTFPASAGRPARARAGASETRTQPRIGWLRTAGFWRCRRWWAGQLLSRSRPRVTPPCHELSPGSFRSKLVRGVLL